MRRRQSIGHATLIRAESRIAVIRLLAITVYAAGLGACSQQGGQTAGLPTAGPPMQAMPAGANQPPPEERLASNDKVRVTVYGEPTLSGEFVVDTTGNVAFPLAGQIQASGLTAREFETSITQKLSGRYLVNPKVAVEVLSLRPIYIMGEVKTVGEFQYKSGLNVLSAVALAGGYTPRSNTNVVFIKRANSAQEQEYPASPTIAVYPGDIVRVSERYF